jgi:hypothetical protein
LERKRELFSEVVVAFLEAVLSSSLARSRRTSKVSAASPVFSLQTHGRHDGRDRSAFGKRQGFRRMRSLEKWVAQFNKKVTPGKRPRVRPTSGDGGYIPASGSGAGPPNVVNEHWCVVASQVAPSLMHQHWAAVEHVPGSMEAEPTHVCDMALQTSPPQVWPAPMQSVSFVHAIPGGGPTVTPGFTVPPPIRLLMRPTLLTDSSVK